MNKFFLKEKVDIGNHKEIYALEILIFKDEAWTLKTLENELSNDKISRSVII